MFFLKYLLLPFPPPDSCAGEHRGAAADLGGPQHLADPVQPPALLPAGVHAGGEDAVARRGRNAILSLVLKKCISLDTHAHTPT